MNYSCRNCMAEHSAEDLNFCDHCFDLYDDRREYCKERLYKCKECDHDVCIKHYNIHSHNNQGYCTECVVVSKCRSCGTAVCTKCGVQRNSILYCKQCILDKDKYECNRCGMPLDNDDTTCEVCYIVNKKKCVLCDKCMQNIEPVKLKGFSIILLVEKDKWKSNCCYKTMKHNKLIKFICNEHMKLQKKIEIVKDVLTM